MCGAPVVLNMLSNSPTAKPLKNPVQVLTAGSPPLATILHKAESLGFVMSHGYGLTETGSIVVSCAWKSESNKFPATEKARLKVLTYIMLWALGPVRITCIAYLYLYYTLLVLHTYASYIKVLMYIL